MSDDRKPRIFFINEDALKIPKTLEYVAQNFELREFKGTAVIELEPILQLMDELGAALNGAQHMFKAIQYDVKQERGVGCDDKCNSYGHSTACFLANDLHEDEEFIEADEALEKYRKFKKGLK